MKEWTIVDHWTGGGHSASGLDKEHYQAIIEGSGRVVYGDNTPEDQISTSDGIYGAHTRAFNTKCIGVAIAAMAGATERAGPPNYGSSAPMTEAQFHKMCRVNAEFCAEYLIPVSPDRVLFHAEVQPTLGIRQNGKWDITVLPWDPSIVGHKMVGDHMRELTSKYLLEAHPELAHLAAPEDIPTNRPTLRVGSRGADVKALQHDLHELRYFSGSFDGIFGPRVRGAVLAFQADNGAVTDGIVGPRTWAAIDNAEARPLRGITEADLEESGTLADTRRSDRLADLMGAGSAIAVVREAQSSIAEVQAVANGAIGVWEMVKPYWPLAVVAVAFLVWRGMNAKTRERRVRDADTGANDKL